MVVFCAFGRLKQKFGCPPRNMVISLKELPHHASFFIVFVNLTRKTVKTQLVEAVLKYDKEFQTVLVI